MAGPFALPLLWRNPHYSKKTKILGSIAVLVLTVGVIWLGNTVLKEMLSQLENLNPA